MVLNSLFLRCFGAGGPVYQQKTTTAFEYIFLKNMMKDFLFTIISPSKPYGSGGLMVGVINVIMNLYF